MRRLLRTVLTFALGAGAALAHAIPTGNLAYAPTNFASTDAWLINWAGGGPRATVVASGGVRGGAVSRSGATSIVTLDSPYSVETFGVDIDPCIGEQPLQRQDTLQVAVTLASGSESRGTSTLVTLGTVTTLTGCSAGTVVPFGALTDPGTTLRHLALNLRPAVSDLVPGVALAGPSEETRVAGDPFVSADVLTLQAGGLGLFAATGHVVPAAFDANQWLVIGLPGGGQRGYARLSVDRRTGAEQWLDADWAAGAPTSVRSLLMVKPVAGAGFGNVRRASRIWQAGLFIGSTQDFSIWLYGDLTGERVLVDTTTGVETRSPLTWELPGANLVQRRTLGGGAFTGERTWKPLANTAGGRTRFVMEDEVRIEVATGTRFTFIKPRVNFYNDLGAATRP